MGLSWCLVWCPLSSTSVDLNLFSNITTYPWQPNCLGSLDTLQPIFEKSPWIQKSSKQVRKSIGALLKVFLEILVYLDQTLDIPHSCKEFIQDCVRIIIYPTEFRILVFFHAVRMDGNCLNVEPNSDAQSIHLMEKRSKRVCLHTYAHAFTYTLTCKYKPSTKKYPKSNQNRSTCPIFHADFGPPPLRSAANDASYAGRMGIESLVNVNNSSESLGLKGGILGGFIPN